MYGPPHLCKRKDEVGGLVCVNVFDLVGVLFIPGHDGMRRTLLVPVFKRGQSGREPPRQHGQRRRAREPRRRRGLDSRA